MTSFSPRLVLVVAFVVLSGTLSAATAACRPVENPEMCGTGVQSLRLIPGMESPNRKFAAGWQAVDGNGKVLGAEDFGPKDQAAVDPFASADDPNSPDKVPDNARDVLVKMPEGKIVASLGGVYWSTDSASRNHLVERLIWSPNSRWMLELAQGKWDTYASGLYLINANGSISPRVDFLAVARRTAAIGYKKFAHERLRSGDKHIRINWSNTSQLADASDLQIDVELVRGQETFGGYTTKFRISEKNGKVVVKLVSVKVTLSP